MRTAILLHGLYTKDEYYDPAAPSPSNAHWFPWLQRQLQLKDIVPHVPEVSFTFKMNWADWLKEVERFEMDENTTLVGHSMGGGFWTRYLSEHPELKVKKVVLVAPWLNVSHEEDTDFFGFKLNPDIVNQAEEFVVFASDNDHPDVQKSVEHLRTELKGANFKDFHNYGHFCYKDLNTDAFPELLEEVL